MSAHHLKVEIENWIKYHNMRQNEQFKHASLASDKPLTPEHLQYLMNEKRELAHTYNSIKAKSDKMTDMFKQRMTVENARVKERIQEVDNTYYMLQEQLYEQKCNENEIANAIVRYHMLSLF